MKNADFRIILLFICLTCFLGMSTKPYSAIQKTTTKLKLIEPFSQNIQINCTDINRNIYFIDNLVLKKEDVLNNKVCFFLNTDLNFTEFKYSGKNILLREYKYYDRKILYPDMDSLTYAMVKNNCKLYEMVFSNLGELPDFITLKLKYHVKDKDALKVIQNKNDAVYLSGNSFWYPRNYNRDEKISLIVKTTDKIAFSINGKAVDYLKTQNYAKEYRQELIDYKNDPVIIIFIDKS